MSDWRDRVVLGINHQFICPQSMGNPDYHTASLENLLGDERFEALDLWICAEPANRRREIALVRQSGKSIHYNIGERKGERPAAYTALDADGRAYARAFLRRELDMAVECGARKVVLGSGPDMPGARDQALDALQHLILDECARLPKDVLVTIEPTDRDKDKRYLLGPMDETVRFVLDTRAKGMPNFAVLLDMGHIPLMDLTIEQAVEQAAPVLGHLHLGNCIIKNKIHPLYGDNHVPWGVPGGEYGQSELTELLLRLLRAGCFPPDERQTVSFEMRPYEGISEDESMVRFIQMFESAWQDVNLIGGSSS